MATEVYSIHRKDPLKITGMTHGKDIGIGGHLYWKADLLAAVAAECNVIIIDRADLPVVVVNGDRVEAGEAENADPYRTTTTGNPNWIWHRVLNMLAVYEYLTTHPPVDEAEVQELLAAAAKGSRGIGDIPVGHAERTIRALLASGRVEVTR